MFAVVQMIVLAASVDPLKFVSPFELCLLSHHYSCAWLFLRSEVFHALSIFKPHTKFRVSDILPEILSSACL